MDNKSAEEVLAFLLEPIKADYPESAGKTGAEYVRDPRSAIPFTGGETAALERVNWYFHQGSPPPVARYKVSRHHYSLIAASMLILPRKLEMDY